MVRIWLNDIEIVDMPNGLKDFEEVLTRDDELRGFVVSYPLDLSFVGDGYKFLKDKKRQEGFCYRVSFRMAYSAGDFSRQIVGSIVLAATKENITRKTIDAVIEDENYGAILKQNSKVPFSPYSRFTKNEETLAPIAPIEITIFTPSTGVNIANTRKMFDMFAVMEQLILFLSDGRIGFQSDFATNLLAGENLAMTSGNVIRNHLNNPAFTVTLSDMMDFFYKKYNLWFYIEYQAGLPVFRLEQAIYGTLPSASISLVKDIHDTYFQEQFWASVKIGGEAIADRNAEYQLPDLEGLSFKVEEYLLKGDCSIDVQKDLEHPFIVDTNIIEKKITVINSEYDDDTFVVQYNNSTNAAVKGLYTLAGTAAYNEQLLNINVINRFCLPNNAAIILGSSVAAENEFEARFTTPPSYNGSPSNGIVPFDSEVFDTDGNYNNVTYRYVAPAIGLYGFRVDYPVTVNSAGTYFIFNDVVDVNITIRHYTTGAVIKKQYQRSNVFVGAPIDNMFRDITVNGVFYMTPGEYVDVLYAISFLPGTGGNTFSVATGAGSKFLTNFTFTQGGIIKASDEACKIIKLEFDRGIPMSDWESIVTAPTKYINVDSNGSNVTKTWIKEAKCKVITGHVSFELLTDAENYNL